MRHAVHTINQVQYVLQARVVIAAVTTCVHVIC